MLLQSPEISLNRREYQKNGFTIIKNLYSQTEVEMAKSVSKKKNIHRKSSVVSLFNSETIPDSLKDFVCAPKIKNELNKILSPEVDFLSVKPVYKDEKISSGTPWHQDWVYWNGNNHKCSVWVALDDANPNNGCLKVIPGSHKKLYDHGNQKGIEFGRNVNQSQIQNLKAIDVPLESGDALFFHDLLLHASHPNLSGRDRWSLIATYRDSTVEDSGCALYENLWSKRIAL